MKKIILPLLVLYSGMSTAQLLPNNKMGVTAVQSVTDASPAPTGNEKYNTKRLRSAFPSLVGSKEIIGHTSYDLQTNGSMQRRLIQNGNRVSCEFTMSRETGVTAASAFTDRGSGYAAFDGTNWSPEPITRIEPARTGFGSMAVDGNGNEVIVAHNGSSNIVLSRKVAGTWTSTNTTLSTSFNAIWPHMATAGNWMYIIASSQDSLTKTNGIRNGYFFSRSNDNGNTWIDNMIPMPLIDSVGHYRGGGNSYSISAIGPYVSIAFGDVGTDLTILYSSDNGVTWAKKVAWNWPIDNYDFAGTAPSDFNGDGVVDTIFTNDGTHSLVVDAQGVSHVAFPVFRVLKDGTGTGYNFFWQTQLAYYNTNMATDSALAIDNSFSIDKDCDADGVFGLGDNNTAAAGQPDAVYSSPTMITNPTITLIAGSPQKIAVAYSAMMDSDTTVDDGVHDLWRGASDFIGQNYRDVFVTISQDNGANWSEFPVNISKTAHIEEIFATTAERITGDDWNILYQTDIEPGTVLQNDDIYDPKFENFMICQKVSIADIIAKSAVADAGCGAIEIPLQVSNIAANVGNINVYPNPSSTEVTLAMSLVNTNNVVVEITDITGAVVYTNNLQNVKTQSTKIPVNKLANGIYNIKVQTDNGVLTQKFVKN
jgi:hypothetical protein